jgi:hypothetical protein
VFLVSGRAVSEYDPRKKKATPVANIGSGARSSDTWDEHVDGRGAAGAGT